MLGADGKERRRGKGQYRSNALPAVCASQRTAGEQPAGSADHDPPSNNSGLQRDPVSLLYIPLFIIRDLRVWQGDQLALEMDGGISISEDPNIRFSYVPNGGANFRAEAVDTEGHVYKGEWPVQPAM
jgi:sulfur-oxidizing protein SoxY